MARKDPSDIVSGAGMLTSIFTKLDKAVTAAGGRPKDIHRLATDEGDALLTQFAELLVVKQAGDKYVITVNYGEQLKTLIVDGGYNWVNDYYEGQTWDDWKQQDGVTPVMFPSCRTVETEAVVVHLDRYAETGEVLVELDFRGLRPADVAELLSFGVAHPEVQREFRIIELGSILGDPYGSRYVASLWSDSGRRYLDLYWYDDRWAPGCRFLAFGK
ncbi:MAG: hypothetical protein WD603_00025 [Patescibacteria group bacterium]